MRGGLDRLRPSHDGAGMFDNLDEVRRDWLGRLARAPRDRKSPLHAPVVVSAPADARVMVLRAFDQANAVLRFHTDARSPKVAAIADDPRMAVLFYDKSAKIQLRVRGPGRIETSGAAADAAWAAGTNFARRCYLGEGPGTQADGPTSGLPPEFEGVEPDDAQLVPARENFAVLLIDLAEVDWLYLAHTGHVRAQFTRTGEEGWAGRWVTP